MYVPKSVLLFDVEGTLVSLGNMPGDVPYCAAWDTFPPRKFPPDFARRNGAPISSDEFKRRVVAVKSALVGVELVIPPTVELFDVEGIPVSLGNMPWAKFSCAAWDKSPPRAFDPESARRNGVPCSPERFKLLVRKLQGATAESFKGKVLNIKEESLDVVKTIPPVSIDQLGGKSKPSPATSSKPQPLGPEKLKALAARTEQAFLENLRVASLMSQEPPTNAKN